jgi:hypothetical protein
VITAETVAKLNTGALVFWIVSGIILAGMLWGFVGCLASDLDEYLGLRIPWLLDATVKGLTDSNDTPLLLVPLQGILGFLVGLGAMVYLVVRLVVVGGLFMVRDDARSRCCSRSDSRDRLGRRTRRAVGLIYMCLGYHGTYRERLDAILSEGLCRSAERGDEATRKEFSWFLDIGTGSDGCPERHICLAETPELAAYFNSEVVIEVDLHELPELSEFENMEARVHGDIPAWRLREYTQPVTPSDAGWVDPGEEEQHPACVERR